MKPAALAPWVGIIGLLAAGCPASHARPTVPPPEYEKPVLPAWEAAAPVDPLESLGEGEWVDETGDDASVSRDAGGANDAQASAHAEGDAAADAVAPCVPRCL